MMPRGSAFCVVVLLCLAAAGRAASAAGAEVTVYSARPSAADREAYRNFERETGIAVTVVDGGADELIAKIAAGGAPEADLFIAVDGGVLEEAKRRGVFGKTDSPVLREAVPAGLRDGDGAWVGVTTRARVIVYAKDRIGPEQLSTYMALAEPEWKGRVLARSSANLYNVSLMASLIAAYGEERAQRWANGMAANLAREPRGGDRDQAMGVAAGEADVALVNSYYLARMLDSTDADEVAAARALGVFFPDQDEAGAHVNICGIGVVKGSENAENAVKLAEFLLSPPAQEMLSEGNGEFPVNPKAKKAPPLRGWGDFKAQSIDFAALRLFRDEAKVLLEMSGWK
ncbi:MAG: extracellular solute-binding protein [Planctomycetota bacterium]|jgi:iron(III) transport system substrate-binding protein|nr:extracellular solute-binding protein [Planctomycetota bacterium]